MASYLRLSICLREKFLVEIRNLERAKDDMTVEQAFMMDKFRQIKAENDRLKEEMAAFRTRLGNATEDYVRGIGVGMNLLWRGLSESVDA